MKAILTKEQIISINKSLQKKWQSYLGSESDIIDLWISKVSTAYDYEYASLQDIMYVYEETAIELKYCGEDGVNKTIEIFVPDSVRIWELDSYLFGYLIAKIS